MEEKTTHVILVRHGQSVGNAEHFICGQDDVPLTALGIAQAERTALYLRNRKIDKIYSSDLIRAMQTAEPTAKMHNLPIIPEVGLREIDVGLWQGIPVGEANIKFAESRKIWNENIGLAHPEGGESIAHLAERIKATVEKLVRENEGLCIALFTHAGAVRSMGCYWQGIPIPEMVKLPWATNASVSEADYLSDGSVRMICYGYDKHQTDTEPPLTNTSL